MYAVFQDKERKEHKRQIELKKNGGKTITMFYSPFLSVIGEEESSHTSYTTSKRGRNQSCHCGSNKKYKHCCLKTGRDEYFWKGVASDSGKTPLNENLKTKK